MKKLAIIGASDLGLQMANYLDVESINFVGYIDDFKEIGSFFNGAPIVCSIDSIETYFNQKVFDYVIIGIGYHHFKFKEDLIKKLLELKIPLQTVIAPNVYIHPSSTIGDGSFILPGTVVDQKCKIGVSTVLNCNVTISHDSIVSDNCFIGPGAVVCGFVNIDKNCFIGANSTIIDHVKIKDNSTLGASSTVIEDITVQGIYIGTPAKIKI